MKAYPITDGELGQLFGLGFLATICFSVGAGLFGFALDVEKDLSLATEVTESVQTFWTTIRTGSFTLSAILFICGTLFVWKRHNKVSEIKQETIFGE